MTRRLHMWVEIHELNEHGQYAPVSVTKGNDVLTGGVYNLRQVNYRKTYFKKFFCAMRKLQGQQRRIVVRVKPLPEYGLLPLVCQDIASVYVGCICARNRHVQKPLDSYQVDFCILQVSICS